MATAPEDRGSGPVIVVGLDGSRASWDAFAWAAGEATRSGGSLLAVYVTPLGMAGGGPSLAYPAVEQAWTEAAHQLEDEAHREARDRGVSLRFIRDVGDARSAIIRAARSARAGLIVVGRSEKWLHHLTGSVGRRLISHSEAPVVVVVP